MQLPPLDVESRKFKTQVNEDYQFSQKRLKGILDKARAKNFFGNPLKGSLQGSAENFDFRPETIVKDTFNGGLDNYKRKFGEGIKGIKNLLGK